MNVTFRIEIPRQQAKQPGDSNTPNETGHGSQSTPVRMSGGPRRSAVCAGGECVNAGENEKCRQQSDER